MLQGLSKESYKSFVGRIKARKKAYKAEVPEALAPLISLAALNHIFDFVLENKERLFTKLNNFSKDPRNKPYDVCIRIDKRSTTPALPRTCYIMYDQVMNDFYLILHTKRKNAEDKPRVVEAFDGASKTGMDTWRIDATRPLPWLSLKIKDLNKIVEIQDEVKVTRQVYRLSVEKFKENTPFLPVFMPKTHKTHIKGNKLLLFTPKGPNSLYDIYFKNQQDIPLVEKQSLAVQLLTAVEFLHSIGVIHQDLSLANILWGDGKLYIIDFGSAFTEQVQYLAVGPHYLDSPEVALYRMLRNKRDNFDQSYGKYLCRERYLPTPAHLTQQELFCDAHTANDMWAVGMILAKLMSDSPLSVVNVVHVRKSTLGVFDASVRANPFYARLLAPERGERLCAKDALQQLADNPMLLAFYPVSPDSVEVYLTERKLEDELDLFFARVESNLEKLKAKEALVPSDVISAKSLENIYRYILQNKLWLEYWLTAPPFVCRFSEQQTGLAFPIQISRDSAIGFILLVDCIVAEKRCTFRIDCFPIEQVQKEQAPRGVLTAFESHRSEVQSSAYRATETATKLIFKPANNP